MIRAPKKWTRNLWKQEYAVGTLCVVGSCAKARLVALGQRLKCAIGAKGYFHHLGRAFYPGLPNPQHPQYLQYEVFGFQNTVIRGRSNPTAQEYEVYGLRECGILWGFFLSTVNILANPTDMDMDPK